MLPFWRKRDWLLNMILTSLAETAVVMPWLMVMYSSNATAGWAEALPGPWLLVLIYVIASIWEAGSPETEGTARPKWRVVTMVGGVIVSYAVTYFLLPAQNQHGFFYPSLAVSMLPAAAYLWYRGMQDAAEGISHTRYTTRFIWEVVAAAGAIGLLVISGAIAAERVQVMLYWSVMLLFATGLTIQMAARDKVTQRGQAKLGDDDAAQATPANARLVVIVLVLLIVSISPRLSYAGAAGLLQGVWHLLHPVFSWLSAVVGLVVYRWVQILSWPVVMLWGWFIRNFYVPPEPQQGSAEDVELGRQYEDLLKQTQNQAEWLVPLIEGILIVTALIVIGLFLYRLTKRISAPETGEEERISLGFWDSLMGDIRSLLRRTHDAVTGGDGLNAEPFDPQNPRSLFRRLQLLGASLGRARAVGETPNRYRDALLDQAPVTDPAATLVTGVYNQARYGAAGPDPDAVRRASDALARLEGAPDGNRPERETEG